MDLSEEIFKVINQTPKIPEEVKAALHVSIMRLVEKSKASPVGKKHGVTIMTHEASLAGDRTARNRNTAGNIGDNKPKSI